jgi:hypothetical protein
MTKRTLLAPLAAALLLACGGDDDNNVTPTPSPTPPGTATVKLRIAHLSPDAPSVDVCLAAAGSGQFSGPVLESVGGASGLAYGQATRYLDVDAGSYDVRIVAATATNCATPVVPDTTGVTLPAGATLTVAATGLAAPASGQPGFALTPLVDETSVAAGRAKVRFVHASPGTPAVDVGAGSGSSFTPLFTSVPFREVDTDAGPNGYLDTAPLANATVSARATGTTTDALVLSGVNLPAETIATVFAVGLLGGAPPLSALVCADDTTATSLLSTCAVLP